MEIDFSVFAARPKMSRSTRALRQRLVLRIEPGGAQGGGGEIGRVVPVENGEVAAEAERVGVAAQEPVGHGMERPAPDARDVVGQEIAHPLQHFARGLVGEGQEQDVLRLDPVLDQVGDPVGQRPGLAAARPRDDEDRPRLGHDRGILLVVERGAVIDLRAGRGVVFFRTYSTDIRPVSRLRASAQR